MKETTALIIKFHHKTCAFPLSVMANSNDVHISRTAAYSSRLATRFLQLRIDGEHTDFKILSGNNSFDCHKAILSANSDVLKAMMKPHTAESSSAEVTIDHIPPPVVEILLNYMYTGEITIPSDLLQSTVKACDYLELLELKEQCLNQAITVLKPSNAISWYKTAENLDLHEIKTKCSEILSSSFHDVSKEIEFLELTLAEMSNCIKDMQETDVDPDNVLEATFGWINYKPDQRADDMEDLVKKIELTKCSAECLQDEMKTHETLLDRRPLVYKLINQSLATIAVQGFGRKRRGRKGRRKARVIVVGGNGNDQVWEFDSSMQFVKLCSLPICTSFLSICETPDGFAVTGGRESTICSMYVLATNSWIELKPLPVHRREHGSVYFHGKIFVFSGMVAGKQSTSVQSLLLDGGNWNDEPSIHTFACCPTAACAHNSIFLLETYENVLLQLDLHRNVWKKKSITGMLCRGARMISIEDELLIAAGANNIFARYNPLTDTWSTGSTPTLEHYFGALVYNNGKVYLIGGDKEDRVEEYSLDTDSWSVCDFKVPKKACNLFAVALDS